MKASFVHVVVKLGGGAITEKTSDNPVARPDIIDRLASEVVSAGISTLVVHGGGSFGHPLARKHNIAEGFGSPKQIVGVAETHRSMIELNKAVTDAFLRAKCPALSIQPSSCFVTEKGRIASAFLEPIFSAVKLGCTPILYGDVVFDRKLGFTILSGDQIATYLARELGARKLVFAMEAAGIYTKNPRQRGATLIEKLTLDQLIRLARKRSSVTPGSDVTGGMQKKLHESISAVRAGITVCFAGVTPAGNIRSAIKGNAFKGTIVEGSH